MSQVPTGDPPAREGGELLGPALREEIREMMARYPLPRSAILNALHRVQEELGWVSPQAREEVADLFGIAPAEVEALVTFYSMYHRQPVGRYVLKVCRSISCYLRGSDSLCQHLEERLGVRVGGTTPDGLFTLLPAECMAACGGAPAMQVNDRYFEEATPERVDALLESLRRGQPVPVRKPGGEALP